MSTSPLTPLRNSIPFFDSKFLPGEGDDLVSDSSFLSGEGERGEVSEPLIAYARELRKNQTQAEEVLWQLLRNRKLTGFKFRRQHPVPPMYILDFFCPKIKLAIELDGAHHFEKAQQEYDMERTNILKHLGIRVIRFTNAEVLNNIEEVLKFILNACNDSLTSPEEEPHP